MKYCRFETDLGPQYFGPQYGEVVDRAGALWIERLLPPPEEDPWTKFAGDVIEPLPLIRAKLTLSQANRASFTRRELAV